VAQALACARASKGDGAYLDTIEAASTDPGFTWDRILT